MFSIAMFFLVIAQLPLELADAGVDAGIGVGGVVMGDESIVVVGADDYLNAGQILGGVDHDFDSLNPVVIAIQLVGLFSAYSFNGGVTSMCREATVTVMIFAPSFPLS